MFKDVFLFSHNIPIKADAASHAQVLIIPHAMSKVDLIPFAFDDDASKDNMIFKNVNFVFL